MKPSPLRRVVSLMLAVLVLAASVGLTVQRNTCRMTGRSKVDVAMPGHGTVRGCAGALVPGQPVAKDNCCDVSSKLHKLSAPAHHEFAPKVLVPAPLLALLPAQAWALPAAVVAAPAQPGPRWFAADASPPPRGGRALLVFVCTLVV